MPIVNYDMWRMLGVIGMDTGSLVYCKKKKICKSQMQLIFLPYTRMEHTNKVILTHKEPESCFSYTIPAISQECPLHSLPL